MYTFQVLKRYLDIGILRKTFKDGQCESVGCNTGHNVGFNLNFEFKNCHQSGQKTTCIIPVQDNKKKIDSIYLLFVKLLWNSDVLCCIRQIAMKMRKQRSNEWKAYSSSVEHNILSTTTAFCAWQKSKVHSHLLIGTIIAKTMHTWHCG